MQERFPPGTSPFHVKGVAYKGTLEYVERELPGGRAQLIGELRDSAVREFFAQTFLDGSWYDLLPLVSLSQALGAAKRQPSLQVLRDLARSQAARDTKGVYKILLKLVSPETVIERAPRAAQQYFDFVTASVEKLGPRSFRLTGRGIPEFVLPVYMAVTEAFLRQALELAGAEDLQHRWLPPEPAGSSHGVPVVQVQREITWR